MLDIEGKYEQLIRALLKMELKCSDDLSDRQYGTGKQIVNAIKEVCKTAKKVAAYAYQYRRLCCFHINNVFNSAS